MPSEKYAFVVRIWREASVIPSGAVLWRGSIDDVGTGARAYFNNLDEISEVIRRKLETEGAGGDHAPDVVVTSGEHAE